MSMDGLYIGYAGAIAIEKTAAIFGENIGSFSKFKIVGLDQCHLK